MDELKKKGIEEFPFVTGDVLNSEGVRQIEMYLDTLIDKVALRVIEMCEETVLNSRTVDESIGIGMKENTARTQAFVDLKALKETISSKD